MKTEQNQQVVENGFEGALVNRSQTLGRSADRTRSWRTVAGMTALVLLGNLVAGSVASASPPVQYVDEGSQVYDDQTDDGYDDSGFLNDTDSDGQVVYVVELNDGRLYSFQDYAAAFSYVQMINANPNWKAKIKPMGGKGNGQKGKLHPHQSSGTMGRPAVRPSSPNHPVRTPGQTNVANSASGHTNGNPAKVTTKPIRSNTSSPHVTPNRSNSSSGPNRSSGPRPSSSSRPASSSFHPPVRIGGFHK